ncbi:lasso peptide biosynthesis B2 protein [Streptomyces lavendulae]|uniref:lasso peptide biosynthesis B2 protein n=1 Tax=Streptomyces lavendulae TaxID=1914 RepID=UPI00332D6F6A
MTALVHAAVTADGVALMDARRGRGRWTFLDPVSAELWSKVAAGQPTQQAIDDLVHTWSLRGSDPDQVRGDLTRVAAELRQADLLGAAHRPAPRSAPPVVHFAGPSSRSTFGVQVAAQAGLATALVLLRCLPIRATVAAAQAATRLPGRPGNIAETEQLHAAVRRARRAWPGRAACLEESAALFLAAAFCGRRVRWVLGAGFVPRTAHAWVEAEGAVIGQDEADRLWPYAAALQVEHPN